jgi:hypothetical protein
MSGGVSGWRGSVGGYPGKNPGIGCLFPGQLGKILRFSIVMAFGTILGWCRTTMVFLSHRGGISLIHPAQDERVLHV